jgi:hypothetical protein
MKEGHDCKGENKEDVSIVEFVEWDGEYAVFRNTEKGGYFACSFVNPLLSTMPSAVEELKECPGWQSAWITMFTMMLKLVDRYKGHMYADFTCDGHINLIVEYHRITRVVFGSVVWVDEVPQVGDVLDADDVVA